MKEDKELAKIYEEIRNPSYKDDPNYDILRDDNITDEKVDWFIENKLQDYINPLLTEEFIGGNIEEISINEPNNNDNGFHDIYAFKIKDMLSYLVKIFYYESETIRKMVERSILFTPDRDDFDIIKTYIDYLDSHSNQYVAYFEFETRYDHVKNLTGDVKHSAKAVFSSVTISINKSLNRKTSPQMQTNLQQINSFYFAISKNEIKRMKIYDKLITNQTGIFKNSYIDKFTDKDNLLIYYWK